MSDVFISYKAEDRRRIQPLVQALQADGYSVWWDEHIGTGDEWRQTIEHQLDSAKCVIVVWSKGSVGPQGHFVRDEASRAQRRHVYVPLLIDAVEPPLGFGESQATSLRGWKGDRRDPRYQAVLSAVRRIAGEASAPSPVVAKAGIDRRAVVAGGAIAVAAAGVGGWALLKPGSAGASDSIAVLPFANLSGDPGQAYFSDGIAEELRSALARLAGLKVVGRTSSEAVRNDDAETAAKKLDVANILTGSVRQSPSTIRVSAQLVDGHSGLEKWSENYDRSPGDVIKIQTDIAQKVASALSGKLGTAARAAISLGGTNNPQAQRQALEADSIISNQRDNQSAMRRAIQLAESAVSLDRNYADGYAINSLALATYANGFAADVEELARDRAEALRLAQIAVRIAPGLPRAHFALAVLHRSNLDFAAGFAEMDKARQLAPGDADMLTLYANQLQYFRGKTDEALRLNQQAISSDPLNAFPYNARIRLLYFGRRFDDAVRYATELQRKSLFSSDLVLADTLVMLGRYKEALDYYAQGRADYWWRLTGEAIIAIRSGDRARGLTKLDKIRQLNGDAASYQYGQIYAQLGDKGRAFAALNRAVEVKDGGLIFIRIDPWLDPLRSDPRLAAIEAKLNFPA